VDVVTGVEFEEFLTAFEAAAASASPSHRDVDSQLDGR
jgi:hypothetical protein